MSYRVVDSGQANLKNWLTNITIVLTETGENQAKPNVLA